MSQRGRHPVSVRLLTALAVLAASVAASQGAVSGPAGATGSAVGPDPAALVRPLDGTGAGPVAPGAVGEFPGADLPFGMIQWSPDTLPNAQGSGGGYAYADDRINGFSLTHLSGTGCPVYQDVPVLPTVGPVGADPTATTDTFSHASERAAPGRYGVVLGPAGVAAELSVTMRSGLARFTFPATPQANVLLKVADSANPVSASQVEVVGRDEVSGSVTTGQFCQTGTDYTLHFVAVFDRPFAAAGVWDGAGLEPSTRTCDGTSCGVALTFDARKDRQVLMKVGISFVSGADAVANLDHEDRGWSLAGVEAAATRQWNDVLGRIRVGGGAAASRRTFYTALYHSLLAPDVVSDVNGDYMGADGRVHRTGGSAEYSDFSEWDIYRGEIQLLALLFPRRVGDMVQSLLDESEQDGWLPIWAIPGGDASQDSGDSADPIIASAYAFGARNFDVAAALRAMAKGATVPESGHGFEIERQYLGQYLSQHYVDAGSLDLTSIDYSLGGSLTLEYALDDFSIAQLAEARGDHALATEMMSRAHNWEYLVDPPAGYLQARGSDGSFPPGPAFQASLLEPGGELGFEEGNAVQYTWSVPQDLAALADLMGGDASASASLSTFFTELNASRDAPYDWAGNEPSLWAPWEFDAFGEPWRTQATVRSIADSLYADGPVDEPGNDDLGALSSWYVWAAIGLYPVTPGTATLALASPLFPSVQVDLGSGHRLTEEAPGASPSTPYVQALSVRGDGVHPSSPACTTGSAVAAPSTPADWQQPWLPSAAVTDGARLTFTLGARPDVAWSSDPGRGLPSEGEGRLPAVAYTEPGGAVTVPAGRPATIDLGLASAQSGPVAVQWQASATDAVVTPASGTLEVGGHNGPSETKGGRRPGCTAGPPSLVPVTLTPTSAGNGVLRVQVREVAGPSLPPVDFDVHVTG